MKNRLTAIALVTEGMCPLCHLRLRSNADDAASCGSCGKTWRTDLSRGASDPMLWVEPVLTAEEIRALYSPPHFR